MNLTEECDRKELTSWHFLTREVKPYGEFRIHTNKNGLRVYVCFANRKYTGYYTYPISRTPTGQKEEKEPYWVHPEDLDEIDHYFDTSQTGKTLHDCVEKIKKDFPGNRCVHNNLAQDYGDPTYAAYKRVFKGSIWEFRKMKRVV